MVRVLVVEQSDVPRAADELEGEGFSVVTAVHHREALTACENFLPDVVVVEGLASRSAVRQVCEAIRSAVAAPLILLSHVCTERDTVAAYSAGVDSVITEPVGRHELIARVRAVLRRVQTPPAETDEVIIVGPVVLNAARRELTVDGMLVRTPRREFDIAVLLMRDAGRVVSRRSIVQELWGSLHDTKSLDVQVGRLRARLAAVEGRRRIVTVRGVGYRFLTDDDPLLPTAAVDEVEPDTASIDLRVVVVTDGSGDVELDDPQMLEGSASA